MAENGPHGHQDGAASDDGHRAPPTTVTFSLASAGPYGNSGSSAGNIENMDAGGKGKNLIPNLNMEEHDSEGGSKDKPRSEAEVEVEVAATDADADKGKSVAADDGELNVNIIIERERRKRMNDLFRSLQDLMPHVPQKTDKVTLVGEAIHYIKFLEEKAAMLGKQKLEQALARQAAARGEASSSSSFPLTVVPQTAQGMAALSSDIPRGWGGVSVPPTPAVPASPIGFKTWSGQNVVLTVANDNAYISVCAPKRANTLSTVMSVLDNHGIDVITVQISSDSALSLFLILAQVTGIDGANRLSEEVFQRAVWEIMLWLNGNN